MGSTRRWWDDWGPVTVWMALAIVFFAAVGAPEVGAAVRDASRPKAQGQHFLASDADVYLDLADALPPSYAMVTDERTGSMTSRAYADFDGETGVTLNLALGRDEATRSLADSVLDDPEPYLDEEAAAERAHETGLPSDQVTFRNGPWLPADVGDRARVSTSAIEIGSEGSITYDVVQFAVRWRTDVAVGEVVYVHAGPGPIDHVALARGIATRIATGPPSRGARIAAAGLVRGADLPGEWQVEAPTGSSLAGSQASASEGRLAPDGEGDASGSAEVVRKATKRDRACDRYAGTIEAATAARGAGGTAGGAGGTSERSDKTVGPHFRTGFDQVQSSVWVSSEWVARATFRELHQPAFTRCLRTVYAAVVEASLAAASLDGSTVDVAVDDLPATGDDALMATVRVDLPNGLHLTTEVVFLRVGGAQGVYTFTTTSDATVRSEVLSDVVPRLEAAT